MADVRIPPHDIDVEQSLLGALLLDKDGMTHVSATLQADHFYDGKHQAIYTAMLKLYEQRDPIDLVTLTTELKKAKQLDSIGGADYIASLAEKVATAAHVEKYAQIVKDLAQKRELIKLGGDIVEMAFDEGKETAEIMDTSEHVIFAISQRHMIRNFIAIKDTLADSFDRLDELQKHAGGLRGLPTGFKDLDDCLAGMQDSNLIILAARPGMGKTAFSLNIAQSVAVQTKMAVGVFSLEMSKEELVDRLLVSEADIDAWRLKTGNLKDSDFNRISDAMGRLAEAPLFIDDTPGMNLLEMRTKARRLQAEHDVKLILVDYLQLATSHRRHESRVQEVQEISQAMKNLARELKIPVLCLSQLSRAVESRGTKEPQLADLRESGCLLGDTLITRADTGEQVKIKDLVGQNNVQVLAMTKDLHIKKAICSKVFSSGKKMVYRLKLKSGKEIKASANHPFFRLDGWSRLDALQIGDRIAVPRKMVIASQRDRLSENRVILLAHLIGDGCYLKRQPIHYTNQDKQLIKIVQKAAAAEFDIKTKIVPQESWFHLYLSASEKLTHGKRNPIAKWLDVDISIFDQRCRGKIIPQSIFQQTDDTVALFLKHLWATDGSITIQKGKKQKVRIYYASGSKQLVSQVSHLLLRLGIISKLSSTSKQSYEDMWQVDIQGKIEQMKFLHKIGCVGQKEKQVALAKQFLSKIHANPNNDVISKDIWQYIEKLRIKNKITTREFHKQLGWGYSGTQRHKHGISRQRLEKINALFDDERLYSLIHSDVYWDEVIAIEEIGVQEVYDATVPKYANFVANDIVVHNSIEQDADVVMFLYREDDENLSDVSLKIAKHRNGALRTIKLFFKGDRIKFFGMERHQQS